MFDAYTVKKVLPRLLIAAILIQLSWPLFTLLVQVTGEIAWGLEGLLYAPFGGRSQLELTVILEEAVGNGTLALALATGVGWVALGAPGLLALAITIVLALFVAIFVLSVRQVILILLLVTAPLALAAWILPNTEKVWKLWWGTFSKLLLMYPLILLLLAAGRITAKIVAGSDINEIIKFIVIILAFFGPFFLIAKTFQFAGGAIASVSGALTGRTGKITSAMNKRAIGKQGAKMSDWRTRADENRLFNPQGRLGRYNDVASSIVNPMAAARIGLGTRGGKALLSQIAQSKWDGTQKLAGALSNTGMNDQALRALMDWDGSENQLKEKAAALREKAANETDATKSAAYGLAASQLMSNTGFLLTSYKDEEYGRGSIGGAAGLALAGQGFATPNDIAGMANKLDKESPGMGLGNTFKTSAELAAGKAGQLTKPGYSVTYDDVTKKWVATDPTSGLRMSQIKKIGVQDIGASKGLGLDGKGSGMGDSFVHALAGDAPESEISPSEAAELEQVLYTAYGSYTNSAIRGDIKEVLSRAEIKKASKRMGRELSDTEAAQVRDVIEQRLIRAPRMSPQDADLMNQQQTANNDEENK